MKKRNRKLLPLLAAIALLSACGAAPAQSSAPVSAAPASTAAASPAPAAPAAPAAAPAVRFSAVNLDQKPVDQSLFAGHRLTMVNVWATDCQPCIYQMPELAALSKDYAAADLQIVGVPADVQTDSEGNAAAEWLETIRYIAGETGADYLQVLPTQSLADALLGSFRGATPTVIFFDESGKQLGEAYEGARGEREWVQIVDALLAQGAAA